MDKQVGSSDLLPVSTVLLAVQAAHLALAQNMDNDSETATPRLPFIEAGVPTEDVPVETKATKESVTKLLLEVQLSAGRLLAQLAVTEKQMDSSERAEAESVLTQISEAGLQMANSLRTAQRRQPFE